MRKYTKPIILILIAAVLGGVYFFANSRQSKTTEQSKQESSAVKLIDLDTQKVSEITIEGEGDKLVLQKKDKAFAVTYPVDFKADSSKVSSIVTNVCNFFAEKVVEENASDTAKYGFNKPLKISVKYDGGVKELEIGDLNSTKDSYYVRESGQNKIYTTGINTIQSINVAKNDLRDTTLFSVKAEDVIGLSLKKGGNVVFTSKKSGSEQWVLTAPIEANADATNMTAIANALTQLTSYVSFEEDKPANLDKYGLKNPSYSLTFETGSGKQTLLLGNDKKQGTEIYAMLEGSQQVFTIDPTALTFLDKPLKEIVESFAYLVNIQDVSKIVVDIDGKSIVSEIETNKDDSSKDKYTVDGKNANITNDNSDNLFKKYYQALIGVTITDIDTNYKPQGSPEITFTYTLKKDPGTMKVEFVPRDSNYYYVLRNGKYANVIVDRRIFDSDDGVRKTYKNLVEGMNKQ